MEKKEGGLGSTEGTGRSRTVGWVDAGKGGQPASERRDCPPEHARSAPPESGTACSATPHSYDKIMRRCTFWATNLARTSRQSPWGITISSEFSSDPRAFSSGSGSSRFILATITSVRGPALVGALPPAWPRLMLSKTDENKPTWFKFLLRALQINVSATALGRDRVQCPASFLPHTLFARGMNTKAEQRVLQSSLRHRDADQSIIPFVASTNTAAKIKHPACRFIQKSRLAKSLVITHVKPSIVLLVPQEQNGQTSSFDQMVKRLGRTSRSRDRLVRSGIGQSDRPCSRKAACVGLLSCWAGSLGVGLFRWGNLFWL